MPNRILKESICASPNIDQLSDKAEAFFYRLLVNCDDYGRFDGRLTIIISRCYPLRIKTTSEETIIDLLMELSNAKLITIFKKDDRYFIQISTWEKHQQIRAHKSKYPAYDNTCMLLIANDFRNQMISDDNKCPRNPIQSNPIRNPILIYDDTKNNGKKDTTEIVNTEVLTNKDLIEIPKKDNVTYIKVDNEGNPIKEKPPKKKKKETNPIIKQKADELFTKLNSIRIPHPTTNFSAERASANRMLVEYTPDQIIKAWKYMKANDFRYKQMQLYLMSVEKDIGVVLSPNYQFSNQPIPNNDPDKFTKGKYGSQVQK